MKKLIYGSMVALVVFAAGAAWANCGSCGTAKAEDQAAVKMTCPCMCVQGVTLTDEQKAKVDAMQAKCKAGCPPGCRKACQAELKKILTAEQFAHVEQNCKACLQNKAGCRPAKKEAPKAE